MRRGFSALAAVLLEAAVAAATPCTNTQSCLAAIEAAQKETKSMTADFVQVKHVQLLDEPIVSRGQLSFRRPDRIRLEIDEPVRSTVLINGRDIHIPGLSEKDSKAMAMTPVAAMFAQLGAVFTGDTKNLQQGFEVTATARGEDGIEVTLVPKTESGRRVFRNMQIDFAGAELTARQVRLEDALGDRLEVSLENARRNVELPDSLFNPGSAGRDEGP